MVVFTDSPMVKKAREGVMEFLLINHPLDCPICDQGGECDLQDQAMAYGRGGSRFDENKRSVKDKYMGPLVKTQMTRCIHCTRCIRFTEDVAGVYELGAVGRGEKMEITTYIEKSLSSELSANIIDLCPVGALTSRPYAFKSRPWELTKTESIDVLDAVGSNIRIDSRGTEVMRILPRLNEDINEEWISDKTRYACDGLKVQRIDRPYVKKNNRLVISNWNEVLQEVAVRLRGINSNKLAAIAGDMTDCETMLMVKELFASIGSSNIDCRQDGSYNEVEHRASYLFNTTIKGIEQSDACLIIGSNPRWEAPIINARIRKNYLHRKTKIALVGKEVNLTYPYQYLGSNPQILEEIRSGKYAYSKILETANNPMIIIGSGVFTRDDSDAMLATAYEISEKYKIVKDGWNGFNVLQRFASRVGGLDIGFVPDKSGMNTQEIVQSAAKGKLDVLFLLGVDDLDLADISSKTFIIYIGHHGDKGASIADIVLPAAAYTEKNATYVNTEGRAQYSYIAVPPPGEAKEDWKIIGEIAHAIGRKLPYTTIDQIRARMAQIAPNFSNVGEVVPAKWEKFGKPGKINNKPFENPIKNFYMTDVISRVSKTMSQCTEEILKSGSKEEAA